MLPMFYNNMLHCNFYSDVLQCKVRVWNNNLKLVTVLIIWIVQKCTKISSCHFYFSFNEAKMVGIINWKSNDNQ